MSMKYQFSYLMDLTFSYCALTGFSPRAFVGFLCCRFACLHRIIRALNLRCMNEASHMCGCSKFEKNVNVTSGRFKIEEEGCGNSVMDLPTCANSCSSPWWCSVCSSWSFGPAVNQQWIPDDACMDKLITSAVVRCKQWIYLLHCESWRSSSPSYFSLRSRDWSTAKWSLRSIGDMTKTWREEGMEGGIKKERKKGSEKERKKRGRNQLTALWM